MARRGTCDIGALNLTSYTVAPEPSTPLYATLVNTDDAGELARQLVCAARQLAREGR